MIPAPALLFPPAADLLDEAARRLVAQRRDELPDLSPLWLLLPAAPAAAHLRRRLAHHAGGGVLGPQIRTLAGFADAHADGEAAVDPLECRLLLAESLKRHRSLFSGHDPARVADALFALFEELTLQDVDPGAEESAFAERLRRGYGGAPAAWLSREAQIVHRLWRAFAQDSGGRSPAALFLARLRAAFAAASPQAPVHLLGFDELPRAAARIVRDALAAGKAALWLQGRLEGHDGAALARLCALLGVQPQRADAAPDARSTLLDRAFGDGGAADADVPLRIVEAAGPEHEARCVDLAVRQALLAGARDVAVLTPDRRLARRLRALLERARVPLQDHAGWALSTSSAAAALNSWLDCLESGFQFRPLLDLLKSAFVPADAAALAHLEREVIYRRGVEGGLDRLAAAARHPAVHALLHRVQAAVPELPGPGTAWAGRRWLEVVARSLRTLGLSDALAQDDAGAQLTRVLSQLESAFARVPLALTWDELRALLDRAIEAETFAPEARSPVRLLTLAQAHNLRCDALVLAGATRAQLPGGAPADPFFNESVRAELGLPGWSDRRALALSRLRNVLEAAGSAVVTYAGESDEEPAQLSPWIEAVESCAARPLRDRAIARLAATAGAEVSDAAGPAQPMPRPAPPVPPELLPAELSATAHQALVDCPYRFFAHSVLRLRGERAPDEDADRSIYGERVHEILRAFSEPVEGRPAPFGEPVTAHSRERAAAKLDELALSVLGPDLDRRALALTWLSEFRAAVPALLDWLEGRGAGEVRGEVELAQDFGGLRLVGRADRLETRADGAQVVVDYKTGRVPDEGEVQAGEAVQLLHYALLAPQTVRVEYLPVGPRGKALALEADLPALREAARARLATLIESLRDGARLPAQGDEAACKYCDYAGLCRREDWHE